MTFGNNYKNIVPSRFLLLDWEVRGNLEIGIYNIGLQVITMKSLVLDKKGGFGKGMEFKLDGVAPLVADTPDVYSTTALMLVRTYKVYMRR